MKELLQLSMSIFHVSPTHLCMHTNTLKVHIAICKQGSRETIGCLAQQTHSGTLKQATFIHFFCLAKQYCIILQVEYIADWIVTGKVQHITFIQLNSSKQHIEESASSFIKKWENSDNLITKLC